MHDSSEHNTEHNEQHDTLDSGHDIHRDGSMPDMLRKQLAASNYADGKKAVSPNNKKKPSKKKKKGGFFDRLKEGAQELWQEVKQTGKEAGEVLAKLNPKEALYQAILNEPDRLPDVLAQAADIPNQDIIYEQLAHAGAYGKLEPGHTLQWGYREAGAEEDSKTGFRCVLYMPTDEVLAGETPTAKAIRKLHGKDLKPVLAFRGTANKAGVVDDMNEQGVGAHQFAAHEAAIHGLFAAAGGKADVTGHSLGGALAQLTAARIPGCVGRVVTFQAPAVEDDEVERLRKHNAKAAPEDQVKATHYRASGDLVHLAGDQLLDGDVYTIDKVGVGNLMDHTSFPLAHLNAARGGVVGGIPDVGDRITHIEKTTSEEERDGFGDFSESVRHGVGTAFDRITNGNNDNYAELWNDIHAMITKGDYPLKMILNIVDATDKMRNKDKARMKANVVSLYERLGGGKPSTQQ